MIAAAMETPDDEAAEFDPFAGGSIEQIVATTEAQREVWLGDRLGQDASLAYNEATALRLRGALDTQALASALDRLVERHDSLRATISPDGTQLLVGGATPLALAQRDLGGLDAAAQRSAIDAQGAAAVREPFSLEHGPLFRAALLRLSAAEHVLLLSAHHAVCDGWSWAVIADDLGRLYAEQLGAGPAPDAPARYVDYAAWETAEAAGPAMQEHVDYWLSRFSGGTLPVLELPLDHARPAVRTFRSKRIDHLLERKLVDALRKLGAACGTSLFGALLGGFAALLHRLTEQDDLVVGIPAAGQLASDMPTLVGHCVNLLPLRLAVDAQLPFQTLVRQCGNLLLDAFEHQTLTYGTLLRKLPVPRDPSRLPLVNVMFNVDRDAVAGQGSFPDLELALSSVPRACENFELFLNITPVAGGMQVETQYNADLFDAQTVGRWLAMFECLLHSAVRDAAQAIAALDMLPAAEEAAVRALQPAPTPLAGLPLMHAGFVAQAAATPERAALRDGAARCSYAELDQQSSRLARALRERGVRRGQRVGLCLNRGTDMLVALLAVLKAGAAYVPLDPEFPQARLDYYAEDAGLSLLLTQSSIASAPRAWCADAAGRLFQIDTDAGWRAQSGAPLAAGPMDAQADDPAYVIYTSGSTGQPKGVCVPHGAVANFLQSMRSEPSIAADDRLAAVTTLSFDIAVLELLLPLQVGAEIVMVPREAAMDGQALAALLDASGATMMQATPGMWRLLVDAQWPGRAGFRALVGGESLPPDLAHELLQRCGEVWNMYGPTETTVWSTLWRVSAAGLAERSVSIGRPIANTTVWIVDARGKPCAIGVPGEIWIGGSGVTLGYLDRPALSAERFVQARLDGAPARMYRTGDRGRWRNDGLLAHMGRFDFQVKVRGYRIELGEIEARCDEAAGVARSVVLAREDQPGDVRLVAYLAMAPGAVLDETALREQLRARLPQYMLPQHVMALPALPLLPNGKIDRKALPRPAEVRTQAGVRLAPRNEREKVVLSTMETVLNLPGLGIRDDFFALGGHSLLAARLATLLGREFELKVPLRTLFEAPTAEHLAAAIDALSALGAPRAEPIPRQPGRRSAPLTPMQDRVRFVEEMHPGRSTYNAPSAHRFGGPLDVAKFEAAVRAIIERQPTLRTAIGPDPHTGAPAALIAQQLDYTLPVVDLSGLAGDQREAALAAQMRELADRAIDIRQAPLFHATLFRMAADDHVFVFVPHHLIWDGWSFDILQNELSAVYGALVRGEPDGLPALEVTHGDYAEWYARWLETPDCAAQLKFWKDRFANAPTPRAPRTDMPRRAGMSGQGGSHWIRVDHELTEQLRALSRRHDVTLNMLTLGVFILMMGSIVQSRSIVIATPVRGREAPELESVMGFFNNLLPLSFQIDKSLRFGEFMGYVKAQLLAVMGAQQVPFERLASEPEFIERSQDVGLYQALFSYQDARERSVTMGGLVDRQLHLAQSGATDDLSLWLMEKPSGLEGAVIYNTDIYLSETGAAFKERYVELLRLVADYPSEQTLEAICAPADTASALYLQRLAASDAPAAAAAPQPVRTAQNQQLLLPEQARLAQIWASALNIDVNEIRASDAFFDLGGDSLLAMRVIQQVEQELGMRVEPRRYVFETLGQLAAATEDSAINVLAAASAQSNSRRGLLGRVFSGWGRKN